MILEFQRFIERLNFVLLQRFRNAIAYKLYKNSVLIGAIEVSLET